MGRNSFNFTQSRLSDLRAVAPGKRDYYYDAKLDGLVLRKSDTGAMSFWAYKWRDGKNIRINLGRYEPDAMQIPAFDDDPLQVLGNNPGLSIEHARQLAAAVIMQITAGKDPLAAKRGTEGITLGDLFKEYLHGYAIEHCKTWKVIEECFYRYLDHWKTRPVSSIKRSEVQLLVNKLGKENGRATANRTVELLRAVINKGKQWELVDCENPATGITKFKLKHRDRFVFAEELPRLIEAINAEENQEVKDYVLISLYTGARKTNVLTMRWADVDLDNAVWRIPDTKNDTAQTILLTGPELEILKARFENRTSFEYVFHSKNTKSPHLTDPKKGWKRILKRARIDNLHLHDLRRTLGSYMAMTGASLSVIGNALNHKDVSTTRKVYAQSAHEAERTAREVAHKKMFEKKEKKETNLAEFDQSRANSENVEF
ncbi:site-specific integrase [Candidatus Obscuribacterales bacterium]|nr:site-specific integrase [Candidatus Obscuribacterales bacterium]